VTDLSIITISTDEAHFLEPCLQSIFSNPPRVETEIWVIDNLCRDETRSVASSFPEVNLVTNRERYGFCRNNNIGILNSTGRYVMLLNPDTEVFPGTLDVMVDFMDNHPTVGACGPKVLNPDGSLQWSCRYFPTPHAVISRGTPLRNLSPFKCWHEEYIMADWKHDELRAVDWVLGACLLVRRRTIAEVGLLDERFKKYYEDIDWCYRMKQTGWNICYVPHARIMHHYQRASAMGINRNTWLHVQSILRYFVKHRLNRA
jgi:hypothetical protein